jgi:hypothetical protein
MKFEIHYEFNGCEGSTIIEGETIQEVRKKTDAFCTINGFDVKKDNMWSEEIKENIGGN